MKLLFSIYGFEQGGVAASFNSLAKELESQGHEIKVILPGYRKSLNLTPAIPARYIVGWTPSLETPIPHLGRLWLMLNCLTNWRFYFNRFRLEYDYDCFVFFHGYEMIWRWYRNVPSVMWFQELASDANCLGRKDRGMLSLGWLLRWSRRKAAVGYTRYVGITQQSAESLQRYYGLPLCPQVINCLFDVDTIKQKMCEYQPDIKAEHVPQIGYVGRLSYEKGLDRLIDAISILQGERYSFHVWIVGDGPLRNELENGIAAKGLVNVHLLGAKANQFPYMHTWDLTVLPSREEGMGMVLWESIICGTPVLATRTGGAMGALENGRLGRLVDNSVEGLVDGLRMFIEGEITCLPEGGLAAGEEEIRALDRRNRSKLGALFSSLDAEKEAGEQ